MKYFALLACILAHTHLTCQTFETSILDYDFNGWFPDELGISFEGPAIYDSTLYVWRPATILNYTPIFGENGCSLNGDGFITAGNYELPSDWQDEWGVYHTYLDFPESSTLGFDSLILTFDLMFFEIGTALFTVELSNDGGQYWYTALQQSTTFGNINGCEAYQIELDLSDYASENLKIRFHHEGWRFTAVDNVVLSGFSDSNQSIGCTNPLACNFDSLAMDDDGSCLFIGYSCDDGDPTTVDDLIQPDCQCTGVTIQGCTELDACNYDELATEDDGTCLFANDPCDDGNSLSVNDVIQETCECLGEILLGCSYPNACNYDSEATVDDGSCIFIGDQCDDDDPETEGDVINAECDCLGSIPSVVNSSESLAYRIYPNPASEKIVIDFANNDHPVECRLHEAQGKLVKRKVGFSTFILDITDVHRGLHFLTLLVENEVMLKTPLVID